MHSRKSMSAIFGVILEGSWKRSITIVSLGVILGNGIVASGIIAEKWGKEKKDGLILQLKGEMGCGRRLVSP